MSEDTKTEDATDSSPEDGIKQARIEAITDCLEIAYQDEGISSSVYRRIRERLADAKSGCDDSFLPDVLVLEERFAEEPENEELRLRLHDARLKVGWTEFQVDTVSGVDPRSVIPWVTSREAKWTEVWPAEVYNSETPADWWLKPKKETLSGGYGRVTGNPRICDDGKWRRDVTQEICVVAVEDLAHLASIVSRMENLILYKPEGPGLHLLTIFDARDP